MKIVEECCSAHGLTSTHVEFIKSAFQCNDDVKWAFDMSDPPDYFESQPFDFELTDQVVYIVSATMCRKGGAIVLYISLGMAWDTAHSH